MIRAIILCTIAGLLAGCSDHQTSTVPEDEDIWFTDKHFINEADSVSVAGTLTGQGIVYKNNSYAITCSRRDGVCLLTSVEQIGAKHVSGPDFPYSAAIKKWTDDEVVFEVNPSMMPPWGCGKGTVRIDRRTEEVVWVEEPINLFSANCRNADTTIRRFTLEASLGWKRMRESVRK